MLDFYPFCNLSYRCQLYWKLKKEKKPFKISKEAGKNYFLNKKLKGYFQLLNR